MTVPELALESAARNHKTLMAFKTLIYTSLAFLTYLLYLQGYIDRLSLVFGLFFSVTCLLISLYTISYAELAGYEKTLHYLIDSFLVALIATYVAPSFILLVTTWTIAEFLGYMVIKKGEEHSIEGPLTSSRGFILTSTLTYELSVFTLIAFSMLVATANLGYTALITPFTRILALGEPPLFLLPLILLGFVTKAANVPMHFWLPGAHSSAPSPGSAALSGLMVSLGYYGLYRAFELTPPRGYGVPLACAFMAMGLVTTAYGGIMAARQRDVKMLLAYSTIATNGFMSVVFGMYLAYPSDLTKYLLVQGILAHAAYKTTLFCEAGLVETSYGSRYVHGIKGIIGVLPASSLGGLLAIFSLLGVPGTIGFAWKLSAAYVAVSVFEENTLALALALSSVATYAALSALVALKYSRIYFGEKRAASILTPKRAPAFAQFLVTAMGLANIVANLIVAALVGGWLGVFLAITTPLALASLYIVYSHFKAATIGASIREPLHH
ncbi:MAG: proton-conducting transporter membrane subunit [Desulfurococcaceae archaeon]|jgi:formate hydrogenlyase subunit 3/multisubunit Na+/H+ antiporter MnhD subunit